MKKIFLLLLTVMFIFVIGCESENAKTGTITISHIEETNMGVNVHYESKSGAAKGKVNIELEGDVLQSKYIYCSSNEIGYIKMTLFETNSVEREIKYKAYTFQEGDYKLTDTY